MDEKRALCSSGAARWRIGREKRRVIGPLGRLVAESPGDPRPGIETGVTAVYRWVLPGCLSYVVKARLCIDGDMSGLLQHRLGFQAKATNIRSIPLLVPMKYTLGLGEVLAF
jgi:hypothetical protein